MQKDKKSKNIPHHIVGIGASAGGLEAIESFFSNMSFDSGLSFVVVQHLSPDYKSLMVELLSKRTDMSVFRAEEGMQVEANCVYLIPPKKNLTIFHGKLLLSEQDHSKGLNFPIDVFLRSLAEDCGEKAVGVILSGTGSDGMRGIRSIKEAGGMVMVQDEETAKFDGMPRSAISTGLADFVLPPEEMPEQLLTFVQSIYVTKKETPQSLLTDEENLTRIFALLRARHKVDFTFYKMSTVIRRIERRMTINQIESLQNYVTLLETHPREQVTLYRELLIGVTSFFRDKEAFDILGEKYLLDLLSRKQNQTVRFWVTACSTGEEAYTLAILCQEYMEKMKINVDLKIFATDVDHDAILHAGNGLYPNSIAADISPHLLSKYFYKKDDNFQIARPIREMVVFAQHNLIKDPPFTNIDLISCRNLLIYLQSVLQQKVLDLFNFSLNPRGILFLGSSESIGDMLNFFEPLHHKWKLYRSRGRRKQPNLLESDITAASDKGLRKSANLLRYSRPFTRHQEEERLLERLLQSIQGEYLPVILLVNDQMELLHVIGDSSDFLKLPVGKMSNDITKMADKDLSIPLSTGLQKVFKSSSEVIYTNIRLKQNGTVNNIKLKVLPLKEKKGQESLAAVMLETVSTKKEKLISEQDQLAYDVDKEAKQRIYDLEQELQFTKENLQATIEELETANEELQATNEELLASNEELQSTNEELQSVNEELHTVNAEYQAKIVELTQLNNDIENLMASTEIPTLFLDENLEIRKFTPQITEVYKIIDKDIGRPITDISHRLTDVDLNQSICKAHEQSRKIEMEVKSEDSRWYRMRVFPYHVGPKIYSGVLLTFIDITDLKTSIDALNVSEKQYKDLVENLNEGVWHIDKDAYTTYVNPALAKMMGYTADEMTGKHLFDFMDAKGKEIAEKNLARRAKGISEAHEFIFLKKNGGPVYTLLDTVPILENGNYIGAVASVVDITENKALMTELESKELRYRQLFDSMQNGVVIYKPIEDGNNFIIVDMNQAGLAFSQVKKKDVMNKKVTDVFPGIQEMGLLDVLREVCKTGKPKHHPVSQYQDEKHTQWFENTVYKLDTGEIVATYHELTQKKELKESLRKSEQRLEMAFIGSDFAWWDWHVPSGEVTASPRKAEMLGYDPKLVEPNLDFWLSLLHPEDYEQAMQAMRDHLDDKTEIYEVEYRLKNSKGKWIKFHDSGRVAERDEKKQPIRVIGMVRKLK